MDYRFFVEGVSTKALFLLLFGPRFDGSGTEFGGFDVIWSCCNLTAEQAAFFDKIGWPGNDGGFSDIVSDRRSFKSEYFPAGFRED